MFWAGTQCTCFTSTKVQILTPEEQFDEVYPKYGGSILRKAEPCSRCVLSLLSSGEGTRALRVGVESESGVCVCVVCVCVWCVCV